MTNDFGGMKSKPQYGDAPIEASYQEKMKQAAKYMDALFNGRAVGANRPVGFILLVFSYGEAEGRCNYISNGADRKDVVRLLEEQAKRFREQGI